MINGLRDTHVVQDDQLVGPAALVSANCVEDTVPDELRKQLLDKEGKQDSTDGSQVEVVDLERAIELERLAAAHQLSATEDDNVVNHEHGGSLAKCSHGGLSRGEAEVLRLVALDGDKGLFEDWP